jgi:hypothetical protein
MEKLNLTPMANKPFSPEVSKPGETKQPEDKPNNDKTRVKDEQE